MKIKLLALFLVSSLTFTASAIAGSCSAPEEPPITEGADATAAQMFKTKKALDAYMKDANAYLECGMNTGKHNRMVGKMEKVAKRFNRSLRAYKSKA